MKNSRDAQAGAGPVGFSSQPQINAHQHRDGGDVAGQQRGILEKLIHAQGGAGGAEVVESDAQQISDVAAAQVLDDSANGDVEENQQAEVCEKKSGTQDSQLHQQFAE